MRRLALASAVALLCLPAAALAGGLLPPLKPTGYRDHCDGGLSLRCPRGGVPRTLWRPLDLPEPAPAAACPVSPPRRLSPAIAPVLGAGPIFPTFDGSSRSTLRLIDPVPSDRAAAGSGWHIGKVALILRKGTHVPFAIRGSRIDAAGQVGFSGPRGRRPFEALQLPARGSTGRAGGFDFWSTEVWIDAPGCYALQIDGAAFSRVIVFRAELASLR